MKKIFMVVVVLAFVACGGAETVPMGAEPVAGAAGNEGAVAGPPEREAVTIDFWHALTGVHFDAVQATVDAFHAAQDYVRVEHIFQGNPTQLNQLVMASAMAGTLPHLGNPQIVQISQYIENNFIHSLNPFIEDAERGLSQAELDDIVGIFTDMNMWGDQRFSVPFGKSTRVLFYNQEMFANAGLQPPTTWAEVREFAEILTTENTVGFGFENAWGAEFQALQAQHGGVHIDEVARQARFAEAPGLAAMNWIAELVLSPYGRLAGEDGFMSGVFGSGGVAMYIGSSAGIPHVAGAMQPGMTWGTAPTPTLDGFQAVQFAGPDAVMFINPNHSDAETWGAWEFLRFTLEPEITAQFAINSGYIPVRYSALELPFFVEYLSENPTYRAATEQFENGFFPPRLTESAEIGSILSEQQELILLGMAEVEAAMQYAQDRANEILGN